MEAYSIQPFVDYIAITSVGERRRGGGRGEEEEEEEEEEGKWTIRSSVC